MAVHVRCNHGWAVCARVTPPYAHCTKAPTWSLWLNEYAPSGYVSLSTAEINWLCSSSRYHNLDRAAIRHMYRHRNQKMHTIATFNTWNYLSSERLHCACVHTLYIWNFNFAKHFIREQQRAVQTSSKKIRLKPSSVCRSSPKRALHSDISSQRILSRLTSNSITLHSRFSFRKPSFNALNTSLALFRSDNWTPGIGTQNTHL